MIAMQYSFVLPADYDMSIIERRVAEKGHLLDDFPDLRFKAYLFASRRKGQLQSVENLYAPFYVWNSTAGMNAFLCGPGFVGVTQSFGWPVVRTWSVWQAQLSPEIHRAVFATREVAPIAPHAALADLRRRESDDAVADVERDGVLGSVTAFEPATWTRVRLRLWGEVRAVAARDGLQAYDIGHMSTPGLIRTAA
ncbi:DUF4865 family protein [Reyranella sp. CPCC 100927]|uniref:DUF4865 family protein n=1 Tax=Reyranella sp. CPCC 100927 TaxID=2599616 RepID=UPI0011B730B9|nr:DUF4865 family protein [Reyranella sp. CPCC 100927]TWT04002.1 DUF4865 family protein [Reyranella sp. CPCC 100927]